MARAWYKPAWPTTNPAKVNLQLTGHEQPHRAALSPCMPDSHCPQPQGIFQLCPQSHTPREQTSRKGGDSRVAHCKPGSKSSPGKLSLSARHQAQLQQPLGVQWGTWTPSSPCTRHGQAADSERDCGQEGVAHSSSGRCPISATRLATEMSRGGLGEVQGAAGSPSGFSPSIPVLKARSGDKR